MSDFIVSLLNCNDRTPTNEFLDYLASKSVITYILEPTRITDHPETLIDNIFSNVISIDAISDNLTGTILDHLPQIMMFPMYLLILLQADQKKLLIKFWSSYFALDYFSTDWDDVLKFNEESIQQKPFSVRSKIYLIAMLPLKNLQTQIEIQD